MISTARPSTASILLLVTFVTVLFSTTEAQGCEREIVEDICPQREGFDPDCERKCQANYPMRIGSGCHLRNTGTLLSLFGIRSFQCRCLLPDAFCRSSDPLRLSFSLDSIASHSSLNKLHINEEKCAKSSSLLSCQDQFGSGCGWQRSAGADWFEARGAGYMPFAAGEEPRGGYLVSAGRHGVSTISLSSCDGLCSLDSVQVVARLWRAPWVTAQLCFREQLNIFCAPINVPNGHFLNETIPQTEHFQISFKFSNVSEGDVILMDDVQAVFTDCKKRDNVVVRDGDDEKVGERTTERTVERRVSGRHTGTTGGDTQRDVVSNRIVGPPRVFSSLTQRIQTRKMDSETLRRRLCREGDCTTISRDPSTLHEGAETCHGRAGLLKCRQNCRQNGDDGSEARCIRDRDQPLMKRCVCHLRRAPVKKITDDRGVTVSQNETEWQEEDGERTGEMTPEEKSTDLNTTTVTPAEEKSIESEEIEKNEIVSGTRREQTDRVKKIVCGMDGDSRRCDSQCKESNPMSSGTCSNGSFPVCHCSHCQSLLCDFEDEAQCGWTDLRLVSSQFNNISIAAKKEQANRYGLSRLPPTTYSGLLRRGWVDGPVHLSVDVYPSEAIDVRICVDSLHKCQTQSVAARTWNRVAAKIKVSRTDKIFLLFYNSSPKTEKTIAMDNITLNSGSCLQKKH